MLRMECNRFVILMEMTQMECVLCLNVIGLALNHSHLFNGNTTEMTSWSIRLHTDDSESMPKYRNENIVPRIW